MMMASLRAKVMRIPLPSDLSDEEISDAATDDVDSPTEEFITLPTDEAAAYLEADLRPDKRHLYWTVPGDEGVADGKVSKRKRESTGGVTRTTPVNGGCPASPLLSSPGGIGMAAAAETSYRTADPCATPKPEKLLPWFLPSCTTPCTRLSVCTHGPVLVCGRPGEVQVLRKELSDNVPTNFEDLSASIRSGIQGLGRDLVDPLGIALDLRDEKARQPPPTHNNTHRSTPVTVLLQSLGRHGRFALV